MFLNHLDQSRHSHIGCTYMTFLYCGFSNVSVNFLHERMQSRMQSLINFIYLTFLHCGFSNVSSNRLIGRMHSRKGCIWVAFLHCVFSNVSSNWPPKKMKSHNGCIYLTFLLSLWFSHALRKYEICGVGEILVPPGIEESRREI